MSQSIAVVERGNHVGYNLRELVVNFENPSRSDLFLRLRLLDDIGGVSKRTLVELEKRFDAKDHTNLRWLLASNISTFLLKTTFDITLTVKEVIYARLRTKATEITVHDTDLEQCPVADKSGVRTLIVADDKLKATFKFLFHEVLSLDEAAHQTLDTVLRLRKGDEGALDNMDKVLKTVELILEVGSSIAEINSISKAVLGVVESAYKQIRKAVDVDRDVTSLIEAMTAIVPFASHAQHRAKLNILKSAIVEMLSLIQEACQFIIDYQTNSKYARVSKNLLSSHSSDEVIRLSKKLTAASQKFDRGMYLETFEIAHSTEMRALLSTLDPVARARYTRDRCCLHGTRHNTLLKLEKWTHIMPKKESGAENPSENFMWLYGLAGLGKSSVASSLCDQLESKKRLGGSFFCRSHDPSLRDANRILPTIAHRLSVVLPPFGTAVANALNSDPDLSTAPIGDQLTELFLRPLKLLGIRKQSPNHPITIVVDAMDECSSSEGRSEIIRSLYELSTLVDWVKVIVTGRPNKDIEMVLDKLESARLCRFNLLDDHDAFSDVRHFGEQEFCSIAVKYHLSPERWPGEAQMQQMAQMANGLFIWMKTVSQFVGGSVDPDRRLHLVLLEEAKDDAFSNLHKLYETALRDSISPGRDNARIFRLVIGAILATATRRPLPDSSLSVLLNDVATEPIIKSQVDALTSVLYRDEHDDGAIRICHKSFADYVTDPSFGCPSEFFVDMDNAHEMMATACLRSMIRELKFNMCALQTSFQSNEDMAPSTCGISRVASYSCVYFGSHLTGDSKKKGTLFRLLREFFEGPRVLFWLEALSIIKEAGAAILCLPDILNWIADPEDPCFKLVNDYHRFILEFYEVIKHSAPHIYLSALPLAPKQSLIAAQAETCFTNSVMVLDGQQEEWPRYAQQWRGHVRRVLQIYALPTGKVVSFSKDSLIRIWNGTTGTKVGDSIMAHSQVYLTSASSDGKWLASAGYDMYETYANTIYIWDVTSATLFTEIQPNYLGIVVAMDFSPYGQYLAINFDDGIITCWSAQTGRQVGPPLSGPRGVIGLIYVSHDATGPCIWFANREAYWKWKIVSDFSHIDLIASHGWSYDKLVFSPNRKQFVAIKDDDLQLWDCKLLRPLGSSFSVGHLSKHNFQLSWSGDGRSILVLDAESKCRVWNLEAKKETFVVDVNLAEVVALSFYGNHLLSTEGAVICFRDLYSKPFDVENSNAEDFTSHNTLSTSNTDRQDPFKLLLSSMEWDALNMADPVTRSTARNESPPLIHWDVPAESAEDSFYDGWTRDVDGWVRDSKNQLRFWLPPDYRSGEHGDAIFSGSKQASKLRLSWKKACYGDLWSNVYTGEG